MAVSIPAKTFTTKQILITAVIVFLIIALISFHFYRKGKKTTTIVQPPADNGTGPAVNVPTTTITAIANDLHTDMDGFNFSGHDVKPYQELMALSNTDFVRVYNTFNTLFQGPSGQTLREWIESESYAFDDVVESIIQRFNALNISH